MRLSGSEIEYLFGEEQVSATAGHLMDERSIVPESAGLFQSYLQLLLDRPAVMLVNGSEMESFNPGSLAGDRQLINASVLRGLPPELVPVVEGPMLPQLSGFEALTLTR